MGRWAMEAAAIVWLLLFKAHLLLILKEMDIISGIDLRGVNVLKLFKTIFKLLLYSICF